MASHHEKPSPDFPLTPCPNGQWRKIVNARAYYFGSWRDDPLGIRALEKWHAHEQAIRAGFNGLSAAPRVGNNMTVCDLIREYLRRRCADVEAHRIAPETYRDYAINLALRQNR